MADRRLSTTLKNLALALLNATLILVAVCLFFVWQIAQSFEAISDQFTEKLVEVAPLRTDLQALAAEGAALRNELETLRVRSPGASTGLSPATLGKIDGLEARLSTATTKIEDLIAEPEALVVAAIDRTLDRATGGLTLFAGCSRPDA